MAWFNRRVNPPPVASERPAGKSAAYAESEARLRGLMPIYESLTVEP